MNIASINPDTMVKPRGYSHALAVSGPRKTIYVGGQNAVDANGDIVGADSLQVQTVQALSNIEKVLAAASATLNDVVKFNIHILQGQDAREGFSAFQQKWGENPHFPAITVLFVAGFANPNWLIEIDAVAEIAE